MSKLQKHLDKMSGIAKQMRALIEKAENDGDRPLTADEQQNWDNMRDAYVSAEDAYKRAKELESFDAGLDGLITIEDESETRSMTIPEVRTDPQAGPSDVRVAVSPYSRHHGRLVDEAESRMLPDILPNDEAYVDAFEQFCRHGYQECNQEQRNLLKAMQVRAQSVGTDNKGGYTVPEGFSNQLEKAMLAYGGIENIANVFETATGNDLPWPTVNDTGKSGEDLNEAAPMSDQDVDFGVITFKAWKRGSGVVKISEELLQDSAFNMNVEIPALLAERLGRRKAYQMCNGNGASASPNPGPHGIVKAATVGHTTSAAGTVLFTDVSTLIHSVGRVYRNSPSFRLAFSDDTLKVLRNLRDESGSNRPLWQPAVGTDVPATIDGRQYQLDDDIPSINDNSPNGGEVVMLAGDFSKFRIRNVLGFRLKRLVELYANNDQIGFQATTRFDSQLLDAGTNPIKSMKTGGP